MLFPVIMLPHYCRVYCQINHFGSGAKNVSHRHHDQLENVTDIIKTILETYDVRLRPNFGGEVYFTRKLLAWYATLTASNFSFPGLPLYIGMDLAIASFDSISEVNMVSYLVADKRRTHVRLSENLQKWKIQNEISKTQSQKAKTEFWRDLILLGALREQ